MIELQDNQIEKAKINFYHFDQLERVNLSGNRKHCDFSFGYGESKIKNVKILQSKIESCCNGS